MADKLYRERMPLWFYSKKYLSQVLYKHERLLDIFFWYFQFTFISIDGSLYPVTGTGLISAFKIISLLSDKPSYRRYVPTFQQSAAQNAQLEDREAIVD